jgi:ATP-binding cassette subfamily B protein
MSSPDAATDAVPPPGADDEPVVGEPAHDTLPKPIPAMWRLCKLGYQHEPRLMAASVGLALLAALPDALLAVLLALLTQGVIDQDGTRVTVAAVGLGACVALSWLLSIVATRVQRRFRDKVTIALESHVARLQASVTTVAHHERPEYLDRLAVLRDQTFVLDHLYLSVFSTAGWILRLGVTVALLASIDPVLLVLVVLALPTVVTSSWRPSVERTVQEQVAEHERLATHLFALATTAPPAKEVRVTGIGPRLTRERRAAWEQWYAPVARARNVSAAWHTLGWLVFGLGFVGAVVYVASVLGRPAAEVVLVLAAGARLTAYVGATVGEIGFLRGVWMDGAVRLAWLEDYADAQTRTADAAVPADLGGGIRFEHVDFAYPGTSRLVLRDVDLDLPAGSVVAVVGENGAGKSTLVKLLAKLYEPTGGRIVVGDTDLARVPADEWRDRLAGAYLDFLRFELRTGQSVGVGDLPRLDDRMAITTAVDRAGAADVVAKLGRSAPDVDGSRDRGSGNGQSGNAQPVDAQPADDDAVVELDGLDGLDVQLGPTWPGGVEVSFGQWQKLALARGFMRDGPLVLVLDEPTAALDAETEHALFERYADFARNAGGTERLTILVSHRFSTVRMADLIVVLDGSRVAEVGTHDDLMARGGQYAELYTIQAAAYS